MPLGFVGLGVMGTPMASHLARAGHAVLGWSAPAATTPPRVPQASRSVSSCTTYSQPAKPSS